MATSARAAVQKPKVRSIAVENGAMPENRRERIAKNDGDVATSREDLLAFCFVGDGITRKDNGIVGSVKAFCVIKRFFDAFRVIVKGNRRKALHKRLTLRRYREAVECKVAGTVEPNAREQAKALGLGNQGFAIKVQGFEECVAVREEEAGFRDSGFLDVGESTSSRGV